MGQSTNGILFYGILIDGDECECQFGEEDNEWEKVYAGMMGIHEPDEWLEGDENNLKLWREYWSRRDENCKESPCIIDLHCSCDYPCHYIAIRETHMVAHRGYPKSLDDLSVSGETFKKWDQQLENFCSLMRIAWAEPNWYLASLWC